MCGIHLVVANNPSQDSILEMLEKSKNRGPDHKHFTTGNLDEKHYSLGHNRLLISGDDSHLQPISNERYDFAINGEIYNAHDLQTKYKLNPLHNDSYILFELLQKEGLKTLHEVNGMFSFILVDKEKHKVHLVRDKTGQKPLYYCLNKNELKVSSELQTLTNKSSTVSSDEVKNYLTYKYTSLGNTIFNGINELLPGYVLTIKSSLESELLPLPKFTIEPEETLRKTLLKSIARTTFGLESPAVLLSGGLDSSIVLHELVALGKKPIAYTLNTETDDNPDLEYATSLCEKLGVEHKVIQPNPEDFEEFIKTVDLPIGDGAFFFTWLLTREIHKDGHKIVITGNGADELFGGYNRHLAFFSFRKYKGAMLAGKKIFPLIPKFLLSKKNLNKATKFFSNIYKDEKQTFLNLSKMEIFSGEVTTKGDLSVGEALNYDREHYLVKDILSLGDQASMAHSVELRSPFLDAIILNSIDVKAKDNPLNIGKHRLKLAFKGSKIQEIIDREKVGFGIPFLSFFGEEKLEEIRSKIEELSPFLSETEVGEIRTVLNHASEKYSNEYWALHILTSWLKLRR